VEREFLVAQIIGCLSHMMGQNPDVCAGIVRNFDVAIVTDRLDQTPDMADFCLGAVINFVRQAAAARMPSDCLEVLVRTLQTGNMRKGRVLASVWVIIEDQRALDFWDPAGIMQVLTADDTFSLPPVLVVLSLVFEKAGDSVFPLAMAVVQRLLPLLGHSDPHVAGSAYVAMGSCAANCAGVAQVCLEHRFFETVRSTDAFIVKPERAQCLCTVLSNLGDADRLRMMDECMISLFLDVVESVDCNLATQILDLLSSLWESEDVRECVLAHPPISIDNASVAGLHDAFSLFQARFYDDLA